MRFEAACCLMFTLAACHSPEPSASPALPSEIPAGDVVASDVVVTVLGEPVTRDQLEGNPAYAILPAVLQPLLDEFAAREGIEATEPEIDRFVAALSEFKAGEPKLPSDESDEVVVDAEMEREAAREVGRGMVMSWKVSRTLHARYGGTVIFQQSNPFEPVGA